MGKNASRTHSAAVEFCIVSIAPLNLLLAHQRMHTLWGHPLNLLLAHQRMHTWWGHPLNLLLAHQRMHTLWGHPLNLHCKGACTRTGGILPKRLFCCRRSPHLIEAVEGEARRLQRRWTRLEEVPLPRQSAAHSRWAPESAQGYHMCSMHRPVCTWVSRTSAQPCTRRCNLCVCLASRSACIPVPTRRYSSAASRHASGQRDHISGAAACAHDSAYVRMHEGFLCSRSVIIQIE
jgi:hypothetical protein